VSAALEAPGVALDADALIGLEFLALRHRGRDRRLSSLPGGFATRRRGQGLELADIRAYQPGDDVRHLDRSATARTGRPHVRTFQQERDRLTLLVADMRPAMLWGTGRALCSVAAAEVLTLIGWEAVATGGRVALFVAGAEGPVALPFRGRRRGMVEVIGALVAAHGAALRGAALGRRTDPPLASALAPLDRLAPTGSEVVLASSFEARGEGLGPLFDRLAQRRSLDLIHIRDGSDRLPAGAYPIRAGPLRRRVNLGAAPVPAAEPTLEGHPVRHLSADTTTEGLARDLALGGDR